MPSFDLIVVGCGGGPSEYNLSSYLLKPHGTPWEEGIVALEAGSGIGALAHILRQKPNLFTSSSALGGLPHKAPKPAHIFSWIRSYLITHAHMDHINGLVLSAGSFCGPPRRIYAAQRTLQDIETVFADRLWPKLASWSEGDDAMLIYHKIKADGEYEPISDDISVRTMPLSHGHTRSNELYESSAFFIRHEASLQEFLFFGDVDSDNISGLSLNRAVWRAAAPKIPNTLSAIFIECSYPSGRADKVLFGHLNPEHLVNELSALAEEVVLFRRSKKRGVIYKLRPRRASPECKRRKQKSLSADDVRGALAGITVYITHCKEDLKGEFEDPIHLVIASQVRALVAERGLCAEIVAVEQGDHITI